MKKFGLLCLAIVLALGTLGIGYALWYDVLYIEGTVDTGELDWEFYCGSIINGDPCDPATIDKQCGDNFMNPTAESTGKDVGCTEVICVDSDLDGDIDTLEVTLNNTYPGYYVHIAWKVHNNGTIPLKFEKATISSGTTVYEFTAIPCLVNFDCDGDGDFDIDLDFGDNFGAQLEPCSTLDQSFDVHVRQTADQGETYYFTIALQANQYNESMHP